MVLMQEHVANLFVYIPSLFWQLRFLNQIFNLVVYERVAFEAVNFVKQVLIHNGISVLHSAKLGR